MQQTPRNMGSGPANLSSSLQSEPIWQRALASDALITPPKSHQEVARVSPKQAAERFCHDNLPVQIASRPYRPLAGPTYITLDRRPRPNLEFTGKALVAIRMPYLRGMDKATALFKYGYKMFQLTSSEQSLFAPPLFADSDARNTVLAQAIKRWYPQTTWGTRILSTFANTSNSVIGGL